MDVTYYIQGDTLFEKKQFVKTGNILIYSYTIKDLSCNVNVSFSSEPPVSDEQISNSRGLTKL